MKIEDNFKVIVLGIVHYNGKIVIGRRAEKDKDVPALTWVFPGGVPRHEELDESVRREIKEETDITVKSAKLIFARTYPEKRSILSLYYLCEAENDKSRPGGDLAEVKWVKPTEVKKYFTTSIHPKVWEMLRALEASK